MTKEQEYIGHIIIVFLHKKPKRQFSIGDYRIDLYFPKEKIAIECDEFGHKDRNQEYEETRENFITDQLKCKFIRFNPDEPNFSIFAVIDRIVKAMVN